MDPLTALSIAGTIVQLVDFGSRIIGGTYRVHRSTTGALPVNEELELITRDLAALARKLRYLSRQEDASLSSVQITQTKALQSLCDACIRLADQLLTRLNGLKIQGRHQVWRSLQHAVKAAWAQKELDDLTTRLSACRKSLETHIWSNLRCPLPWQYCF